MNQYLQRHYLYIEMKQAPRVPNIRCALFSATSCVHFVVPIHLSRDTFKISCSAQMLFKATQMWWCVWCVCGCKYCGCRAHHTILPSIVISLNFCSCPRFSECDFLEFVQFQHTDNFCSIQNKKRQDLTLNWASDKARKPFNTYICYRNATSSSFFFFFFLLFLFFRWFCFFFGTTGWAKLNIFSSLFLHSKEQSLRLFMVYDFIQVAAPAGPAIPHSVCIVAGREIRFVLNF